MNNFLFTLIVTSFLSFRVRFAQDKNEIEYIDKVANSFLSSIAKQLTVSSDLIASESLDKAKEMNLSMALNYDSTGTSNAIMLLPANKIKSMSSAEVWDYMKKISERMKKLDMDI